MGRPRTVDPAKVAELRAAGLTWDQIAAELKINRQTAMRAVPSPRQRAIDLAVRYGQIDGAHHKAWVIDQMVRVLTGCPTVVKTGKDFNGNEYDYAALGESRSYRKLVDDTIADGYSWDVGIAP